ncbi:MAG: hypothetical protein E6K73_14190 [Candidatus Eisenbacteria bacterium]|uniref:Type IX secretion system sortase PorU n=1 Tax=Eiseniibacteriota bacterium TaxID=2212470 RepID=A0A538S6Q8_UNCEI|nr:MAG: hypothetical protein E6K73_14190 [Candidatus Eisenbacteria bacterium]
MATRATASTAVTTRDWANLYDPSLPDTVFLNHPYETTNYYYVTVSTADHPVPGIPRRMGSISGAVQPGVGGITPTTFTARAHFEEDDPAEYWPNLSPVAYGSTLFWEKWFWTTLDVGRSFSTLVAAPGIDPGSPARLRIRLWGREACGVLDPCFRCSGSRHVMDLYVNGAPVRRDEWNGRTAPFTVDTTVSGLDQSITVRLEDPFIGSCADRIDKTELAWIDLFYPSRFVPAGDTLAFDSPSAPGDYVYRIGPFTGTAPPRVFDITDSYAPVEVQSFEYLGNPGNYQLSFEAQQGGPRRYRIIPDAGIVQLRSSSLAGVSMAAGDLRDPTRGADYLVIYYDEFRAAADSLAEWRKAAQGMRTATVPISAIYDQFSGGRTDPGAIRSFLRAVSPKPKFVTLLGDASYDFKNYHGRAAPGQPGSLLPTYENGFDLGDEYATDDWLLSVDDGQDLFPDYLGGRIPAPDAATALDVVRNKVLFYERSSPLGEYRDRVMLIADDDKQGSEPDPLRWSHVSQTSVLDSSATPPYVDRVYVYLHTYPDGPGPSKPGAKADIINQINGDGVTVFNFVGHGSPYQMADERVFLESDAGSLTNASRLPVFIAASCDIGRFDDPKVASLGELLLLRHGGGAIGVISATELALSFENADLNRSIYKHLFSPDTAGRYPTALSEALLLGKLDTQRSNTGTQNIYKYQLMGDAATRLNLPEPLVEVALYDSAGNQKITTIRQGQTVTVRGQVIQGSSVVPIDGVAGLLIEDSAPLNQTPPCDGCFDQPYYYYKAGPIFRGDVGLSGGNFQGRFVVPLEARQGARARVRAYVSGVKRDTSADAVGSIRFQLAQGGATTSDHDGPRISLSFAGGATAVRPDALLHVDLYDQSGILITGHSLLNAIVVTLDDNTTNRVDITSTFRYAADSYQSGTASYRLEGLAAGSHRIRVSAADNLATGLGAVEHRSSATIDFEVVEVPPLRIETTYLFPNPTRSGGSLSGGRFVVDARGDSLNLLLRIYTASGRLLRTLNYFGGLGQVQIPWDGLDDEGQRLANGVYVFKIHANVRDAEGRSSPRQEASAEGKFVVVNR